MLTQLNQNAALLNNTSEILNGLKSMNPKAYELSQGIGKSIPGRMEVMWANRAVNFIKSRIPILGNNQALKNHIVNALKNANSLNAVIKNIDEIPKQNIDSATKQGLDKFVNEVIPQIKQMIKQSEGLIKGDGFTMAKEGKLTYLDEVKFELDEVLKDKTDISDRITTSLAWLQSRHPEMFKNKRAVKELIEYVLKDPSEIKPGKSESSVYLAKRDGG